MSQSRNYTSLLNPSYLQNSSSNSLASAAAAAAAAAAEVSAAIANGTPYKASHKRREHEDDRDNSRESREERRKKRKSRWGGSEHEKTFIPGMPTVLPTNLTPEQEKAYLYQLQIEEISRKLRTGDLGIPPNPEERSPSPEPIYSSDGKRLNTREYRTRRKLEEERHNLIQKILKINPEFKPPPDYKPPIIRVHDKVMIPQEEHPDINFVGLLIGPRGNTLKSMEKETGAKIIIRGKGSVKEGKVGRKDGQPLPGEDEPLHAYITANNLEAVKKAVERIHEIIRQGVEVPEGQNDLRRNQLRELALLNGTLRENDGPRCTNCGASDHKSWLCPDKPNVTNNIVCSSCGGAGHIAKDCRSKRPGMGGPAAANSASGDKAKIDEEYMSLMAELGEGPPPDRSKSTQSRTTTTTTTSTAYPGLFDRQQPPRALMPPTTHPPPQMMPPGPIMPPPGMVPPGMTAPPNMPPPPGMTVPPGMPPVPGMGVPPGMPQPGMAPPPWIQQDSSSGNMQWPQQPPVSMPPPPGVMPPPLPPPGTQAQSTMPPMMPWNTSTNNQPPPPGQISPTMNNIGPLPSSQLAPPGTQMAPNQMSPNNHLAPPGTQAPVPPGQFPPNQGQMQPPLPPALPPPQMPPGNASNSLRPQLPPGMGLPPWQQQQPSQQTSMRPPPPGTTGPPPGFPSWQNSMNSWPPLTPVPPPPQISTSTTAPGIDLNNLPNLLAQPPPPPPPSS